jgi:hypothetical protein
MTDREFLIMRCTKYMMCVECQICGDAVYPHEDDAKEQATYWVDYDDVQDIDGLKDRIDRICDYHRDKLDD